MGATRIRGRVLWFERNWHTQGVCSIAGAQTGRRSLVKRRLRLSGHSRARSFKPGAGQNGAGEGVHGHVGALREADSSPSVSGPRSGQDPQCVREPIQSPQDVDKQRKAVDVENHGVSSAVWEAEMFLKMKSTDMAFLSLGPCSYATPGKNRSPWCPDLQYLLRHQAKIYMVFFPALSEVLMSTRCAYLLSRCTAYFPHSCFQPSYQNPENHRRILWLVLHCHGMPL